MLVFKVGGIVVAVVIGIVVAMYSISDPTAITVYGQLGPSEPEPELAPDPLDRPNRITCLIQGGYYYEDNGEPHCIVR